MAIEQEGFFRLIFDDADVKKKQIDLEKRTRQNKLAQKELNDEIKKVKEGTPEYDKLIEKSVKLKTEQKLNAKEQAEFNNQLKNTAQAGKSMKELTKDVSNFKIKATDSYNEAIAKNNLLRSTLKKTKGAFGDNSKEVDKLKSALESNNKTLIDFDKSVNSGSRNVGRYKEDIGELINGFGGLPRPVQQGITLLKAFRISLAATGIGLIVVALGSLVAAFVSTQRGTDAVNKVLRPLGAIMDRVVGLVQDLSFLLVDKLKAAFNDPKQAIIDLGNLLKENIINRFTSFGVIVNAFVKGDLQGIVDGFVQLGTGVTNASEKISGATREVSKSIAEAKKIGEEIDAITKSIELQEIELAKRSEKLKLISKQQNDIAEDTSKSGREQAEAAQRAIDAQRELEALEIGLLNDRVKLVTLENRLNDTGNKAKLEQAELEAEIFTRQTSIQEAVTTLRNKRNIALARAAKEEVNIERGLLEEIKSINADKIEFEKTAIDTIALAKESARRTEAEADILAKEEELARELEFQERNQAIQQEFAASAIDNGLNFIQNFFSGKSQARVKDLEEEKAKLEADVQNNRLAGDQLINVQNKILGIENEISEERNKNRKEFLKNFLKDTIKAVESFLITQIVKSTAGSLAQADSIATFGATGLARASILVTAIKAAGAGLNGLVDKFEDGGIFNGNKSFTVGGKPHSQGGTLFSGSDGSRFEAERDEVITILKKDNKVGLSALSRENVRRGGVDFFNSFNSGFYQNGGIQTPIKKPSNIIKISDDKIIAKLSIEQLKDELNTFNTFENAGSL